MRKLICSLILALSFLAAPIVLANEPVNVYLFHGEGCPHCKAEREFFNLLRYRNSHYDLHEYEVWNSKENRELLKEVAQKLDIDTAGVPITIINGRVLSGFLSADTTGEKIEGIIEQCWEIGCDDPLADIISGDKKEAKQPKKVEDAPNSPSPQTAVSTIPEEISLPIIGKVNIKSLSLPLFTVIMGLLDGFNPCAMWALLFLISLLLKIEDRRKMWLLGGTFIFVSGAIYFLFMTAWLNVFLFLGFIVWVRILIGAGALASGAWHLREFIKKKEGGCSVTEDEKRRKFFDRFKDITHQKKFWMAWSAIVVLAISINLVELLCSAGLPAVYTQILTLSNFPRWHYYLYLLLYIFFFMIDDMIVFIVAMVTLRSVGLSTKYGRWTSLIGGIVMLIIGLLLILKPGWLMFG